MTAVPPPAGPRPAVSMPAFAPLYGVGTESTALRWLTVEYRTDPEVIAGLLPAPLEPSGDPLVAIWVAEFLGAGFHLPDGTVERRPPYFQGGVSVRCRRGDETGAYPLTFFIEGLNHGTLGRELFGLPKKQAREVALTEDASGVRGRIVTAGGIEVIDVHARPADDPAGPPGPADPIPSWFGAHFTLKLIPSAEGDGYDVSRLVRVPFRSGDAADGWRGTGRVTLRPSAADPLHLLACRDVVAARFGRVRLDVGFGTYLDHVTEIPTFGVPTWS
ncbi:acetoacetate decarboxylase family protein [Actinomadura roseirufa]|uniref:acetoacetate decarboxylase family protein n=1 Tax=Actinomadura roseirufa TaxID=2094049 RepID=UPI00104178C9|nr:acetoacetate decarboxylase family protein [Actinomadura roseirufa]